VSNITLISDNKKDNEDLRNAIVYYNDGTIEEYECTFLGTSTDYPPLLVIILEEEPVAMIHGENVRKILLERVDSK